MKCPYRKKIFTYPEGVAKITDTEFMQCIKNDCPYWGRFGSQKIHSQEGGYKTLDSIGCRKVEKECQ